MRAKQTMRTQTTMKATHGVGALAGLAALAALGTLAIACATANKPEDAPASGATPDAAPAPPMSSTSTSTTATDLPAPAEEPAPNAEPPPVKKPPTRIEFDDRTIEGQLVRPDGSYVESRKKVRETPDPRDPRRAAEEDLADLRVVGGEAAVDSTFQHYGTNPTIDTAEERLSTFSVDVDTASYSIVRAMLREGQLPDPAAVRVEEVVNSFRYDYPPPKKEPFSVVAEAFPSPSRPGYHVLLLGLKGAIVDDSARPPANLVFVIDVSGSMGIGGRLETVKQALGVLVDQLHEDDSVSIVVYGDTARAVLSPTSGTARARIKDAIARLAPEGSTNVQAGVMLGYEMAKQGTRTTPRPTTNRVILLSDGVANNGITTADGIFDTVSARAKEGVALSTVGVGMGNYNDVLLEQLAVKGQGRYAYVDDVKEAKKTFQQNLSGELVTIASDVKIQLELDPASVTRYRLLGFENRKLKSRDFHDDKVDAGEIGAGHEVTALYEVKLKPGADRIGWLRVRAKPAASGTASTGAPSRLIEEELTTRLLRPSVGAASPMSRLALVSSMFAEKLRGSYWARTFHYDDMLKLYDALPKDVRAREDVAELGGLIRQAQRLDRRPDRFEGEAPVATMDFDALPVLRSGSGG